MSATRDNALAKLTIAALAVDLLMVFLLSDAVSLVIGRFIRGLPDWSYLLIFPAALVLHMLFVELVLGGRSVGRMCLGLAFSQSGGGKALSTGQRAKRVASILATFGTQAFGIRKPAFYHGFEGVSYDADLLGAKHTAGVNSGARTGERSAPDKWQVRVIDGNHTGKTMALSSGREFRRSGYFNIGRNQAWADLVLTKDQKISGEHCRLKLDRGRLWLIDHGRGGAGSTNFTFVGNKKLVPGKAHMLRQGDTFSAAGTRISVG